MLNSVFSQGRRLLTQAAALLTQVEEDLRLRQFEADDLRMKAYNDLTQAGANLFPDDPVLNGGMVRMPDADLQFASQFTPEFLAPDRASKRLHARLTQFISRLELVLGESAPQPGTARPARDVLAQKQSSDVRAILNALESLRGQQPELPPLDVLNFAFIARQGLRQVLKQDFEEAQRAFVAGAFKACSLLAGGLIEGMLLDKLQQPEIASLPGYDQAVAQFPRAGGDINWDRVGLTRLIRAVSELALLTESAFRLTEGARDFRDTVHPIAELREGLRAGREEAELLLALVKLVHRDLAR